MHLSVIMTVVLFTVILYHATVVQIHESIKYCYPSQISFCDLSGFLSEI